MKKSLTVLLTLLFTMLLSVGVLATPVKVAKVKGLKATKISEETITMKWTKTKKAVKYQVKYSTDAKLKKAKTKTVAKNKFTASDLEAGTKYYFKVRAISKTNYKGKWSATKNITTKKNENKLLRKNGYFYIKIIGDGKTSTIKVNVSIDSTKTKGNSVGVKYSFSGTNNHNFNLAHTTGQTYLEGVTPENYMGTGCYNLIQVPFTYTNTAHQQSIGTISNNYLYQECRWAITNFVHTQNSVTREGLVELNLTNIGLREYKGKTYHATMTLTFENFYSGLKVDPNGGTWTYKNKTYNKNTYIEGEKCGTTLTINNPKRDGYTFTGWTLTNGKYTNCSIKNNILSFCGKAETLTETRQNDYYVLLTATWKKQ